MFYDLSGSQIAVINHEVQIHRDQIDECDQYELESQQTHLRFTNQRFEMPVPVVVYADFESAIDEKNKHKPIMFSCLAMSRIPTIQTQLQVFHAPHKDEHDLRFFMDYLIQLQESVKRHLFNELPLEVTPKVDKDYRFISVCPFCHKKLESDKVRHHAYVVGEYSNGVEVKHYEAGQNIFTCCKKCNLQLSFNKENYRLPVYLHNGSHYDFTIIIILIASMDEDNNGNLEVIPTTEDKEMHIKYHGIQSKDSLKLINSPLKTIVTQILRDNLEHNKHTKTQLRRYCEEWNKHWSDEYIDLLTRKESMFFTLIKSYSFLTNISYPLESSVLMI